jgi:hypothetical protein
MCHCKREEVAWLEFQRKIHMCTENGSAWSKNSGQEREEDKKIVTLLTTKEGDSKMMEGDFKDVVEKLSDQGEKCCEKIQLCILWRVVTSGSGIEKINLCKKVDSDG